MVRKPSAIAVVKTLGVSCLALATLSVGAYAQDADAAGDAYADLLRQIEDMKISIAHQEVYIQTQEAKIASLEAQIAEAEGLVASVDPMLKKMAEAISTEIESDIPFNAEERFNRLGAFQDILADEAALPADKMRRALDLYNAEVNYGQTMESSAGNHPLSPGGRLAACENNFKSSACALDDKQVARIEGQGESIADMAAELKDGHYLRYGRLAYAFAQVDGSSVLRYDPKSKEWVEVKGGDALDIRRAVKMANGEQAPGVVEAPVYISN